MAWRSRSLGLLASGDGLQRLHGVERPVGLDRSEGPLVPSVVFARPEISCQGALW